MRYEVQRQNNYLRLIQATDRQTDRTPSDVYPLLPSRPILSFHAVIRINLSQYRTDK
jgi:hypothetical protein